MNKYINEYYESLAKLKAITGHDYNGDERINELIDWYRKEIIQLPIKNSTSDVTVIKYICNAAMTGLSLNMSLMEAYRNLKDDLLKYKYNLHI